jgi:hypothetical protein
MHNFSKEKLKIHGIHDIFIPIPNTEYQMFLMLIKKNNRCFSGKKKKKGVNRCQKRRFASRKKNTATETPAGVKGVNRCQKRRFASGKRTAQQKLLQESKVQTDARKEDS